MVSVREREFGLGGWGSKRPTVNAVGDMGMRECKNDRERLFFKGSEGLST